MYLAGRALFDRLTGLISSLILSTSALYFALAHVIILDMAVSVFLSAGLLACHCRYTNSSWEKTRFCAYGTVTFLALAGLTKGLMSKAIFSCVVLFSITLTNTWTKLLPLYLPSAFTLFWLYISPGMCWFIWRRLSSFTSTLSKSISCAISQTYMAELNPSGFIYLL